MKHSFALALSLPLLAFAPDGQSGSASAQPLAEIVTYTLKPDVDPATHLRAAEATNTFLTSTGAVLSRSLSLGDGGLWTDHILWTSREAARKTEEQAMQRPEFQSFFAGMNEASVTLRHAPVMMQLE